MFQSVIWRHFWKHDVKLLDCFCHFVTTKCVRQLIGRGSSGIVNMPGSFLGWEVVLYV